jgi:carboxylate-amine ligase
MSITGTLGAEEELQLFEPATGALAPNAPRLLRRLPTKSFSAELQRSTVEMNTATTTTLQELHNEIVHLRAELRAVAAEFGLAVASVGMAPMATDEDFELTMRGRFSRMHEEYRVLVDEQLICGYQVHVGVADRDLAVRVTGRLAETLPVLLALSASSPFWRGRDTGYASMRTMIWQRWPTSGGFDRLETMAEYEHMIADLVRTGVISDAKMAYFDVRPYPRPHPRAAHVRRLSAGRRCRAHRRALSGRRGPGSRRRRGGAAPAEPSGAGPARRPVASGPQWPGR